MIDNHNGKSISMSLPTTLQFNNQQSGQSGITKIGIGLKSTPAKIISKETAKIGHKDIYSDLEFQEYFDFNNLKELFKTLIQSFVKNYVRMLISEPFEVTRLILQVGFFSTGSGSVKRDRKMQEPIVSDDDDYDDEDINFFASASDISQPNSPLKIRPRRKSVIERSVPSLRNSMMSLTNDKNLKKNHIKPTTLKTLDVMSALLSKEGSRGLWRAINTSFIYRTLSHTIEAWLTGFLSPFLNIPDPFFIDIVHSSDPFKSLCLSIAAGVITLIILQPIDLIRLKFIVTSTTIKEKRSFRKIITSFHLRDYIIPTQLIIPALHHSLASIFWKKYTPYLLYTKFNIDNFSSPFFYSTTTLLTSLMELLIKLPLELLLRRAQLEYLLKDKDCNEELRIKPEELSFQFAGYYGYLPTLYYIYKGIVPSYAIEEIPHDEINENQGIEAIYRGWKVGLLNVLGSWGLDVLKDNVQPNYKEEKF